MTRDPRPATHDAGQPGDGLRLAQAGMLLNTVLAIVKVLAGLIGHSYALIADGIESVADIFGSLIVWSGLRVARRSADDHYPFGYGKAEALAAAAVGLMLLGAAIGISIEAIREIMIPHHAPAPFTLAVLVCVVLIKELFFRRVSRAAVSSGSTAVQADAWHHRSDAITSLAAFIGISIALIGGPGWEQSDDWAALLAACVIVYNGVKVMRPALGELMDRAPGGALLIRVERAAHSVTGVLATEKLKMRRAGTAYYVDIHVQADPVLSLHEAHILSGMVKGAIRREVPEVSGVLIHMEPFEDGKG
ncbi:MAG: cobalt-zinc-cadmium resistance protein [Gemmatimonadetes bacterium]|nr:cobalt-zinc-cadmium resistance protein [Gemmatimonadota bacterium]